MYFKLNLITYLRSFFALWLHIITFLSLVILWVFSLGTFHCVRIPCSAASTGLGLLLVSQEVNLIPAQS